MAYAALPAKIAGDTFSLTNYDAIKDNFAAGVPALYTTKGDLAPATGNLAAARLAAGANGSTLLADSTQTTGLVWQIQPAALVRNSAGITVSAGIWTGLTFDNERFDTDNLHSTVSNTGRLTIPAGGDGIYLIGASVQFDSSAVAVGMDILMRVLLGGTTVIAQVSQGAQWGASATYDTTVSLTRAYSLVAGNYIELQVYATQNVNTQVAANYSPEFWAIWQRRA